MTESGAVRVLPSRLVLLGAPVSHSLSPAFQNAALRAAGMALSYEAVHVAPDAFASLFRGLAEAGAAGNVTIPHKEAAAQLCDVLTPLARRVGAVNTFWAVDGAVHGDNTDVGGFAHLARTTIGGDRANLRVALLGAGGAAAAVLAAIMAWPGAQVALQARTRTRADRLAERSGGLARVVGSVAEAVRGAQVVVNATPAGLRDDTLPAAVDQLADDAVVLDLVYRRGGTAWVLAARARGLRASDGLPMLVEQGALAFERWFGYPPDREAMWRALA